MNAIPYTVQPEKLAGLYLADSAKEPFQTLIWQSAQAHAYLTHTNVCTPTKILADFKGTRSRPRVRNLDFDFQW